MVRMHLSKEERGLGRTWWLLILLVVIVGIYVGIKIFAPYFHYWMMQDTITEAAKHYARVKPRTPDEVIQKVWEESRNQDLTLDREDIRYSEDDRYLYLSAEWTDKVAVPYYTHTFKFKVETTEQLIR